MVSIGGKGGTARTPCEYCKVCIAHTGVYIYGRSLGVSAKCKPTTNPSRVNGQSLVRRPLTLNVFLHYHNLTSWPWWPKMILPNKKFHQLFGGNSPYWPPPLDPPVVAQNQCLCVVRLDSMLAFMSHNSVPSSLPFLRYHMRILRALLRFDVGTITLL